jgi:chorismate mutase/prephenate dehydratase
MTPEPDLQALREAIEQVDGRLLDLLRERMALAERIARAKIDAASPFRDPAREDRVLQGVRARAVELGLDPHAVEALYRDILEMSIARQQAAIRSLDSAPLRVAYQGVEGSYSHLAAQRRYGGRAGGVLLDGHATFAAAAAAVRSGAADLALLPIENTTAGSINETYDLLAQGGLTITGEVVSHVEHCLLALPGVKLEELRTVMSHPQALAQCEAFFHGAPWLAPQVEFDTAGAARKVRESGDRTLAAIASESAARVFGLAVVARAIQTQAGNYTRFVEVAREALPGPPDAPHKTSLVLSLAHRPGALGEVLARLGAHGVNLTKLESRPVPGRPFEYRFYLDLEGHAASQSVAGVLDEIRALAGELRVLGTYPRALPPAEPGG